ncbi:hypothetical protein [uncultured Microbacterium sp.]|uniref:hypothetical protein n=1 Tax=uncultured Microbacterium sp. TaxID=191216 RepID=UPI0025F82D43|nr:hypothetical protein [uncultured Microbacterium sp.]
MTEITAPRSVRAVRTIDRAIPRATGQPHVSTARFALWRWFPREILQRGGRVDRDIERGYRDLQAARDRSEW